MSEREAKAEIELEKQRQKTAKAETALLQMREAMVPRSAGTTGNQNDELHLFSGTKFFITFASDTDSQDLAKNIIGLLQRAEWETAGWEEYPFSPMVQAAKISGGANLTVVSDKSLFDGVTVMAKPVSWDGLGRFRPKSEQAGDAAKLLCIILRDNHLTSDNFARYRHWPDALPDDACGLLSGENLPHTSGGPMILKHSRRSFLWKRRVKSTLRKTREAAQQSCRDGAAL